MTKQKRTRYQIIGIVSLSLIIAAASYGFIASSTDIHSSGFLGGDYGVKSIYGVSKVSYTLDLEDPSTFVAVSFVLDADDAVVTAGVSATKNDQVVWADDCEKTIGKWTCSFNEQIDVFAADWLHVSPAQ